MGSIIVSSPAQIFRVGLLLAQYGSYSAIMKEKGARLDAARQKQYDDYCIKNWKYLWERDKSPRLRKKYQKWRRENRPTLFEVFWDWSKTVKVVFK